MTLSFDLSIEISKERTSLSANQKGSHVASLFDLLFFST